MVDGGGRTRSGLGTRLATLLGRATGAALPPGQPFRVTVVLDAHRLPPGITPGQATVALRRAVLALPGALDLHAWERALGRDEAWLTVAPPGSRGRVPPGGAWRRHRDAVERVALQALAGLDGPAVAETAPARSERMPAPLMPAPGFAEAMAGAPVPPAAKRPRGRPRKADRVPAPQPASTASPALALLEQLAADALRRDRAPAPPPAARPADAAAAAPAPASPPMAPASGASSGPGQWSDQALLARLLSMAGRGDMDGLAARLLARHGSFAAVLALSPRELRDEPGVNQHVAAALKLVHGAALRLARAQVTGQPVLDGREALLAYLTAVLARERVEQFHILFLDAGHRLISDEAQARGTVNHTPVYPREVARRALELEAASLILVHNHPSGDPTPSREDVGMTGQVRRACAVVGVEVQDHLIVGSGRHFSFRDAGLLEG